MPANNKPLPARPVSQESELTRYEPSLTNPDMLLPNATFEATELPESGRPPSPSYLVIKKKKTWNNIAGAYGSSPTLETPQSLKDHRLSFACSSINSDDLEAMQIPEFASLDSDTETLEEDEFDVGTPTDMSYGVDVGKRNGAEQSSVTLMRAELILANAKKRLNMMDQNLRGAREMVAPLTAANLKRATSLGGRYSHMPQATASSPNANHLRVFSNPENGPDMHTPERSYSSMGRVTLSQRPPVNKTTPSWTSNPLRGSRSSDMLRTSRATPEAQLEPLLEDEHQPNQIRSQSSTQTLRDQMLQLRGRISTLKERAHEDNLRRRSMLSLRDNCPLNNADSRPSLVKITKESHVPGAWVSANTIPPGEEEEGEDGILLDEDENNAENINDDETRSSPYTRDSESTERATTVTTQEESSDAASTIYEDAPDSPPAQRHEDREDAFDYSRFFLHSATGSFTRPRAASTSSSEGSVLTARAEGPDTFVVVPPTPETPETLRNIELQHMHNRAKSSESVATIQTFETAQEAVKTPPSIAEWLRRSSVPSSRTDSRQTARTAARASRQSQDFVSVPPSPAAIAVAALTDPTAPPLGLKDKALVFTVVESLRVVLEQLQTADKPEHDREILRSRLDDARRALGGVARPDA